MWHCIHRCHLGFTKYVASFPFLFPLRPKCIFISNTTEKKKNQITHLLFYLICSCSSSGLFVLTHQLITWSKQSSFPWSLFSVSFPSPLSFATDIGHGKQVNTFTFYAICSVVPSDVFFCFCFFHTLLHPTVSNGKSILQSQSQCCRTSGWHHR